MVNDFIPTAKAKRGKGPRTKKQARRDQRLQSQAAQDAKRAEKRKAER